MSVLRMREFVSEYCRDLVGGICVNEVVVQGDGLTIADTRAECVGGRCSPACVFDDNFSHGDAVLGAQREKLVLELPFFERLELIEDPHERDHDEHNNDHDGKHNKRAENDGHVPEPAEQHHDNNDKSVGQNDLDDKPFRRIKREGLLRGFVKAVFLFDNERIVVSERKADDKIEQREGRDHDQVLNIYVKAADRIEDECVNVQRQKKQCDHDTYDIRDKTDVPALFPVR